MSQFVKVEVNTVPVDVMQRKSEIQVDNIKVTNGKDEVVIRANILNLSHSIFIKKLVEVDYNIPLMI